MREKLMKNYLKGQIILSNKIRSFMSEERGASDIVAVIVLIVIILAVAAIFKDNLTKAVEKIMKNLTNFVG